MEKTFVYVIMFTRDNTYSGADVDYEVTAVFEELHAANDFAQKSVEEELGDPEECEEYEESFGDDGTVSIHAVAGEGEVYDIEVLKKELRRVPKAEK